jgi:predicted metal-dependent hydrolase
MSASDSTAAAVAEPPTEPSTYDSRYLEFFERFNRQQYFEAHEVLEGLWLATTDARRDFFKGLIQTAAAFVKLQQGKPEPAARLAKRARSHLQKFQPLQDGLNVEALAQMLLDVERGRNPMTEGRAPRLELVRT